MFAQVNQLGFLETPYMKVEEGKVKINEDPIFLTADEEEQYLITHSSSHLIENQVSLLTIVLKYLS